MSAGDCFSRGLACNTTHACNLIGCQRGKLCMDRVDHAIGMRRPDAVVNVVAAAEQLVAEAARQGIVLTVEQVPLQPLAMGNYETVVSVRPARGAP